MKKLALLTALLLIFTAGCNIQPRKNPSAENTETFCEETVPEETAAPAKIGDMPEPFPNYAGDSNLYFYATTNLKLGYIDMSFAEFVDNNKEFEKWFYSHSSYYGDFTAVDEAANLYSFIKYFDFPADKAREILVGLRNGTEDDFSDEEINLILSGTPEEVAEHFAHENALRKGKSLYSLNWIYLNSIDEYKKNGLSPEDIKNRIPYFNEYPLSGEAETALEKKLSEFIGEPVDIVYEWEFPVTTTVIDEPLSPDETVIITTAPRPEIHLPEGTETVIVPFDVYLPEETETGATKPIGRTEETRANPDMTDIDIDKLRAGVKLSTDKKTYREGEDISTTLSNAGEIGFFHNHYFPPDVMFERFEGGKWVEVPRIKLSGDLTIPDVACEDCPKHINGESGAPVSKIYGDCKHVFSSEFLKAYYEPLTAGRYRIKIDGFFTGYKYRQEFYSNEFEIAVNAEDEAVRKYNLLLNRYAKDLANCSFCGGAYYEGGKLYILTTDLGKAEEFTVITGADNVEVVKCNFSLSYLEKLNDRIGELFPVKQYELNSGGIYQKRNVVGVTVSSEKGKKALAERLKTDGFDEKAVSIIVEDRVHMPA